jgi:hypothetical protein
VEPACVADDRDLEDALSHGSLLQAVRAVRPEQDRAGVGAGPGWGLAEVDVGAVIAAAAGAGLVHVLDQG